jgi:hypothetical protein
LEARCLSYKYKGGRSKVKGTRIKVKIEKFGRGKSKNKKVEV